MPHNIGPEMLEVLDEALASGELSQGAYDAQRAEVMELIRKGKAVELTVLDRVLRVAFVAGGILLGLLIIQGGTLPAWLLGIAVAVGGVLMARRAGRVRP